jgi:CarD family transcriptional regulator
LPERDDSPKLASNGGRKGLRKSDPGSGARVGETVVYAAHGVGRVVAIEHRRVGEVERECVVLELATGLRVTLPIDNAASRLRPLADRAALKGVGQTLAAEASGRDGPWTRRLKANEAKLSSGMPNDLAEIVRDGACYEHSSQGGGLPVAERRVYRQARDLLVSEISSARGIGPEQADAWIESQIAAADRTEVF